jgi:hypothetical protein
MERGEKPFFPINEMEKSLGKGKKGGRKRICQIYMYISGCKIWVNFQNILSNLQSPAKIVSIFDD